MAPPYPCIIAQLSVENVFSLIMLSRKGSLAAPERLEVKFLLKYYTAFCSSASSGTSSSH